MERSTKRGSKRWLYITAILLLLVGYFSHALLRPLSLNASIVAIPKPKAAASASSLNWPKDSQAAIGILGNPILETHNKQTPAPIASVAKVITALTVLQKYPLKAGEQGPTITLTDADVALYNNYAAQNGSVVKVQAGETISEYQMLQAMMLPSANNLADSLAIWAYGSLQQYVVTADDYLTMHQLKSTLVRTDASGLSPTSTSTAQDLVRIGELAMNDPVLAGIVSQSMASNIPVVGTVKNVNFLLGQSGIVGIKTGNSDQAGGVFLAASKITLKGKPFTIISAVVGGQSLFSAMKENLVLTQSAQQNFQTVTYLSQGVSVGSYDLPWGGTAYVNPAQNVTVYAWGDSLPNAVVSLNRISIKTKPDSTVGNVRLAKSATSAATSAPVLLQTAIRQPSVWWRVTHPF